MKRLRYNDMSGRALLTLGLCATTLPSIGQTQEPQRMNILYIMSDDHSFQTIGAYGSQFNATPNIDRIADGGVIFNRSYVANSISGPSRACMLTGKHSHVNGYTDNENSTFDGDQQTYPKLLQEAGYQTAIVGKWHLTSLPQGFDRWNILIGQGSYYQPTFIDQGETVTHEGYATTITTDLALDWLDNERDKSKPFCLLLHHKAPHRNWFPDLQDLDLYEGVTFELPENFHDDYDGRKAASLQDMSIEKTMDLPYDLKVDDPSVPSRYGDLAERIVSRMTAEQREVWDAHYAKRIEEYKSLNLSGRALTEWKYQQYMRDYLQVIESLDRNIGRVLDYLEANGLMENTMIVYTSDQGFYMGEHGWFDKRFIYEESFRTPLLVRLPGYDGDSHSDELVQNIDYAPTFLEVAGVDVPTDIQGESFLPLLKEERVKGWRKSLYYHFYEFPGEHSVRRHYGVVTQRYKLIKFYGDIDEWELYDLKSDPHEMNNIYSAKSSKKIIKRLKSELSRLRSLYNSTEE